MKLASNTACPRRRALLLALPALPLLARSAFSQTAAAASAGLPRRLPSGPQSRSIHSGHSLVDSYIHSGPWPGHLRRIGEEIGLTDPHRSLVKSTIPGAPLHWRWRHPVPDLRPGDATADARRDIADFDTLVLAEGGPPARLGKPEDLALLRESLDYLCRFAARAIMAGDGGRGLRDIALWSIWPALTLWRPNPPPHTASWQDLADFHAALAPYGDTHRYLADHASHVLRRNFPDLPPDWRIWIFPGHLFMARLWDDAAAGRIPGITAMADLFEDDIHPTPTCGFGLACLMMTCLYQIDLSQKPLTAPAGVSPELRDYFATISWQIATSYAPAGLGGAEAAAPLWLAGRDADLLEDWTPSAATRDE